MSAQLIVQICSIIIFYSMFGGLLYLVWRNGRINEKLSSDLGDAVQTTAQAAKIAAESAQKLADCLTSERAKNE